ncbi:hypothetical protein [Actinoallomurus acanthiterrae]
MDVFLTLCHHHDRPFALPELPIQIDVRRLRCGSVPVAIPESEDDAVISGIALKRS